MVSVDRAGSEPNSGRAGSWAMLSTVRETVLLKVYLSTLSSAILNGASEISRSSRLKVGRCLFGV